MVQMNKIIQQPGPPGTTTPHKPNIEAGNNGLAFVIDIVFFDLKALHYTQSNYNLSLTHSTLNLHSSIVQQDFNEHDTHTRHFNSNKLPPLLLMCRGRLSIPC